MLSRMIICHVLQMGKSAVAFRQQLMDTGWKHKQAPSLQQMLGRLSQPTSHTSSLSTFRDYLSSKTVAMRSMALA